MPKILPGAQGGIQIQIGLGFDANCLQFFTPTELKFNWIDLL